MVDLRWVVLRCAHDLKRARKDQSYQRGTRPAKTSDAAGSGLEYGACYHPVSDVIPAADTAR